MLQGAKRSGERARIVRVRELSKSLIEKDQMAARRIDLGAARGLLGTAHPIIIVSYRRSFLKGSLVG